MMSSSSRSIPILYFLIFLLYLSHQHQHVVFVKATQPEPRRKIALLHMYNNVHFFARLGHLTGTNKARYAARHGYDMIFSTPRQTEGIYKPIDCMADPNQIAAGPDQNGQCWADDLTFQIDHTRAPTFGKIKLALASCKGRDNAWLLWTDADAMVVNQSVPLESIIDDGYDIMFAEDWLMMNAGMLLLKCSPWTKTFLTKVYEAREFDEALALDQSAIDKNVKNLSPKERDEHVKIVPKYVINVYTEEYQPGDFLLHFAGKLYEATEQGIYAIAQQFDILSIVDDREDIEAFFHSPYLLNYYSGTCPLKRGHTQKSCPPTDPRRIKLKEPLLSMSYPNRYRHVGIRYYWLQNWKDKNDVPGWDIKRKSLPIPGKSDYEKFAANQPVQMPLTKPNEEENQKADVKDNGENQQNDPPEMEHDTNDKLDFQIPIEDDGKDNNNDNDDDRDKWPKFAWLLIVIAFISLTGGVAYGYSRRTKMSSKMQ